MTGWFIVIYHRRTFTGWTGSIMGCEQRTQRRKGILFTEGNGANEEIPWLPSLASVNKHHQIDRKYQDPLAPQRLCVSALKNTMGS